MAANIRATVIVSTFPQTAILATHAPGTEPTYESLHLDITQLNANATSIPTDGGNGLLIHLALTVGYTAYATLSTDNVAHPGPPAPAAAPNLPPTATSALISELRQQFTDIKATFRTYYAVDAALKKQLLAATNERFMISLKDQTHGFALVLTCALISHLYTTYGNITFKDLSANENRIKAQWDQTNPIKGLFEQINDGSAYATAGNDAFTDTQLVRFGYNIINSNGCMRLACRDWRGRPKIERTWPNLKTDFKAAHLDLRLCTTAGAAGFNGQANHATHTEPDKPDDNAMQAYLTNLAKAALATNATVASLTATVAQLKGKYCDAYT